MTQRCGWVNQDPLYIAYHDEEWGVPKTGDRELFELLTLEGAQAGLSWYTILKKRENYRNAFDHFDIETVAAYGEEKISQLLLNEGIVRNRLKIASVIKNANVALQIQKEEDSFSEYLWSFVGGKPLMNHWQDMSQVPARTLESDNMSKALKKKGMSFVGSTICYAFMQASGMVNDHIEGCDFHKRINP